MRLPDSSRSSFVKPPLTPVSFVSPSPKVASKSGAGWQAKLKRRSQLVKENSFKLPMEPEDEPVTSRESLNGSHRPSFFQDAPADIADELSSYWDSKAEIEYIDDEDDIAALYFRKTANPSTYVENNEGGGAPKPPSRPTEVSSPLTQRGGMRQQMTKQLSGYNFSALLLEEEA